MNSMRGIVEHPTLEQVRGDPYFNDWQHAIDVGFRDQVEVVPPGADVSDAPFTVGDIVGVVIARSEKEVEWNDWSGAGVFALRDGRFAAVEAWSDSTGWG